MVTFSQIKNNLQDVTSEQIGKCTKIIHNAEEYYLVESETDDLVEYEVRYSEAHGFTCNCKAGEVGFSRITVHPSGVCKHVRWSIACFLEQEAAMQEIAEKQAKVRHNAALPAIKISSTEKAMPDWIMNARPTPHMKKSPREK